jgi:hypothetical protein
MSARRKYVGPEICQPGENMSARKKKKIWGAAPEPPRGGLRPPLTPLHTRRKCSDTTTRAKNIKHTQHSQMMLPSLSLIAPPSHATVGFPFVAPSKFSLRNPDGGESNSRILSGVAGCALQVCCCVILVDGKKSRIRESWYVSCDFSILQLQLCTISLI